MLHFSLPLAGLFENRGNLPQLAPVDAEVHGADTVQVADGALVKYDERKIVPFNRLLQTLGQTIAHAAGLLAGVPLLDFADGRVAGAAGNGGRGHGAAAEGFGNLLPALVETGAQVLHAVPVPADSARSGVAAGNDLAKNREVGVDAEEALGPVDADAEAGNDFIEDEQSPVLVGQALAALNEFL